MNTINLDEQVRQQKQDFVYWSTEYIKRKIKGVKIKQVASDDAMVLTWTVGGKPYTMTVPYVEQGSVFARGPDAIKALIQKYFYEAAPHLAGAKAQ